MPTVAFFKKILLRFNVLWAYKVGIQLTTLQLPETSCSLLTKRLMAQRCLKLNGPLLMGVQLTNHLAIELLLAIQLPYLSDNLMPTVFDAIL